MHGRGCPTMGPPQKGTPERKVYNDKRNKKRKQHRVEAKRQELMPTFGRYKAQAAKAAQKVQALRGELAQARRRAHEAETRLQKAEAEAATKDRWRSEALQFRRGIRDKRIAYERVFQELKDAKEDALQKAKEAKAEVRKEWALERKTLLKEKQVLQQEKVALQKGLSYWQYNYDVKNLQRCPPGWARHDHCGS